MAYLLLRPLRAESKSASKPLGLEAFLSYEKEYLVTNPKIAQCTNSK